MISIDFAKAFATIWWDGIDTMMDILGYDEIFWELIKVCYFAASYLILVEGSPMTPIKAKRGIQ